ncbi:MAG TPA: biotin/lipoyl-containing protein [Patescibacteria group bacterium]|nr:biotin/lipoyl-containing protein [Patescibacteria group bacterium]
MIRDLRVDSTAASRLPGDEPRRITAVDHLGLHVEAHGPGRWVIHAVDGIVNRAATGPLRRNRDGIATIEVDVNGWRFELEVEDAARADLRLRANREPGTGRAGGPVEIRAIIPGRVAGIQVAAGDRVKAGQSLLVVEAMKMQNELRSPRAGVVARVAVDEGQTIENGDVLVVLG